MSSPSQRRLSQARLERQRAIKFADQSNPGSRVPAPILVRRGNTEGLTDANPLSPGRPTVDVQDHQIVGRAPPVAQFKMVTPPRSPITSMIQRKGSRVPLRSRSTTLVYTHPKAPVLAATPSFGQVSQRGTSTIPVRKNMPVQPHRAHLSSNGAPVTHKRGALPQAWFSGLDNPDPAFDRRDTMPSRSLKQVVGMEHRRTASDPVVMTRSGFTEYPQLSVGKRNVLVSKLRMLLKSNNADEQALDEWEIVPSVEETKTKSS
ncbi:hypothetical protein FRC07_010742, partial [Ceratobasidium sp. 392]